MVYDKKLRHNLIHVNDLA